MPFAGCLRNSVPHYNPLFHCAIVLFYWNLLGKTSVVEAPPTSSKVMTSCHPFASSLTAHRHSFTMPWQRAYSWACPCLWLCASVLAKETKSRGRQLRRGLLVSRRFYQARVFPDMFAKRSQSPNQFSHWSSGDTVPFTWSLRNTWEATPLKILPLPSFLRPTKTRLYSLRILRFSALAHFVVPWSVHARPLIKTMRVAKDILSFAGNLRDICSSKNTPLLKPLLRNKKTEVPLCFFIALGVIL